jgi:hypothetical protein
VELRLYLTKQIQTSQVAEHMLALTLLMDHTQQVLEYPQAQLKASVTQQL